MRNLLLLSAFAALAAVPAKAAESQAGETYGKLFGGVVFDRDYEVETVPPGGTPVGDLGTDTGFDVGGALGYQISDMFAIEGEVAYRLNSIDAATIAIVPAPADPDLNALSFMANGVFTAPSGYGITPYVGAGAGTARVGGLGDHDFVFAYQAFGGLKTNITDRIAAGVEYRYFGTNDAPYPGAGGALEIDYDTHSVNFVLSRKF